MSFWKDFWEIWVKSYWVIIRHLSKLLTWFALFSSVYVDCVNLIQTRHFLSFRTRHSLRFLKFRAIWIEIKSNSKSVSDDLLLMFCSFSSFSTNFNEAHCSDSTVSDKVFQWFAQLSNDYTFFCFTMTHTHHPHSNKAFFSYSEETLSESFHHRQPKRHCTEISSSLITGLPKWVWIIFYAFLLQFWESDRTVCSTFEWFDSHSSNCNKSEDKMFLNFAQFPSSCSKCI